MVFVLQLGAVLAAGMFAALAWGARPLAAGAARSLVVIACALSYIFFWSHLSQNVDGFRSERVQWRAVPPEQAVVAGAAAAESGLQSSFAEWIRPRIGPNSRFYLVPSPTQDVAVYQWFTYRLLPSLATDEPQKADWLIFYGIAPAKAGLAAQLEGAPLEYATGYSIARVRRAG
jgi:hypothetical protein